MVGPNSDECSWFVDQLHPFNRDVGTVVPEGFAKYARIFHPPYLVSEVGTLTPVRWNDIAAANELSLQAEFGKLWEIGADPSQYSSITGKLLWNEQPMRGSIPFQLITNLTGILAQHTSSSDYCYAGVWEGFGGVRYPSDIAARVVLPGHRTTYVYRRQLSAIPTLVGIADNDYHSPNIWWPGDRSWFVATEIDYQWTYVGGASPCIQQILRDERFESCPTHPDEGNFLEK